MSSHILVIGGSGRTGRKLGEKLQRRGYAVRVMARYPAIGGTRQVPGKEVVVGDITDAASVSRAMQGIDGVVIIVESAENDHVPNSPRRVHFEGTQHVLAAASPHTQIVLVTQIYITRPERYPEVRSIIHWRGQAEAAVLENGVTWPIVQKSGISWPRVLFLQSRFSSGRKPCDRTLAALISSSRIQNVRKIPFGKYSKNRN